MDKDLANADSYVECGLTVFDTIIDDNNFRTIIKPNTQGTMVEEKMIMNCQDKKKKEWDDPPIEVEDGRLLGLYRTFSTYDLSYTK